MPLPLTVRRTVLTAITVILLGAGVAVAQEQEPCDLPPNITLDKFTVSVQPGSEAVHLEPIDLATKLKWTIGILVPNLVKDEVGIHLYNPSEINQSHINMADEHVIPFIVCRQGNSYWAKRATILPPQKNDSHIDGETDYIFFGATVPIPRGQQNTPELVDSVKGNLRAFPPLAQSNTTVQQLQ